MCVKLFVDEMFELEKKASGLLLFNKFTTRNV